MALPVVNDTPTYKVTIPSTKREVKFRPFLVKEQKILLMALESRDAENMVEAMHNTIRSCVFDDIDVEKLSTFDSEYIFTKIRAKSVGEHASIGIYCSSCEHVNTVPVDLDKVEVIIPKSDLQVKLNDQYTIQMKYPSYKSMTDAVKTLNSDDENASSLIFSTVIACLDKLMGEDELLNFDDESKEEVVKFLDGLNPDQFKAIGDFAMALPQLTQDIVFNCEKCDQENEQVIEGIQSFFM